MPTGNYSAPQSDLNFSNKMHKHVDFQPITMSLVKQIIEALPNKCSSYIEAILFANIFSLAFFGFVENRRSSLIWNIRSYFRSLHRLFAKHN